MLYIIAAFALGFALAWIIRSSVMYKQKKVLKSTEGFLESERLKRETLKNENTMVHRQKQTIEIELSKKLKQAHAVMKQMDEDILLLQKSNEETEALLQAGQPEIHDLKLKLMEANNTISRMKGN
jgi:uncharacterized protein HemX